MKSAIMIRMSGPISTSKLPNRSDSEEFYKRVMENSAKAELQTILEKGKRLYGPMSEEDQFAAIEWAYDVKINSI